ncbi:MAG: protease modulator HflC [bacterium]|nr:protease modulator HflC [bacterium]
MNKQVTALVGLLALLFVGFNSLFVINEGEQAVITRFGEPVRGPVAKAGLYFKIPMVEKIHLFDKRILKWDGDPNEIPTKDKKYIWVDTTARWKIVDPLLFLQRMGSMNRANMTMSDLINGAVRDFVTKNNLVEIVRSSDWDAQYMMTTEEARATQAVKVGRDGFSTLVLNTVAGRVSDFGIELLDVLVKRVNYTDQVREKVYARMISERNRIATQRRSEGEAVKAQILGETEKEMKQVISTAYKSSQEIRGKADAEATKIFGEAFNSDPEFYRFIATMEAYKTTLGKNTRLVIDAQSPLYNFLAGGKGR